MDALIKQKKSSFGFIPCQFKELFSMAILSIRYFEYVAP